MAGIIKALYGLVSGGPYYVQLSRARLVVKDIASGGVFDDVPFVGFTDDKPPKIAALGATANMLFESRLNPFSHPRIIVSDFEIAEALLVHAFKIVSGNKYFKVAPEVIMHPIGEYPGGLCNVERRLLTELAVGAGARLVTVWEGAELSDEDIRSGKYKQDN